MNKKKFAVITINVQDDQIVKIHDLEYLKRWIHGVLPVALDITPLTYLTDGPDNPVEDSIIDVSYHIEFEEFSGEPIKDTPITLTLPYNGATTEVSITNDLLVNIMIDSGIDADIIKGNEAYLWCNDKCIFIETALGGFDYNPECNFLNPKLVLVYDSVTISSLITRTLLNDKNIP